MLTLSWTVLGISGLLVAAGAVALVARLHRFRRPHAALAARLTVGGTIAYAAALISMLTGLVRDVTPRFYGAMLMGMGVGAMLAALYLALLDRRA
jgi:hypothetical protein